MTSRRGLALLLTVVILALLSASAIFFLRQVHLEARMAENGYAFTQAEVYARAGLEGAMTLLAMDDNKYDSLDEMWAQFEKYAPMGAAVLDMGTFSGKIEDQNSKFNPNYIVDSQGLIDKARLGQLERLLDQLQIDKGVIPAILDWIDPDDQSRPGGAEDDYYTRLEKSYRCANHPFDTPGQMLLVKGVTPRMLYGSDGKPGFKEVLTVQSNGLININTASEMVLLSLDDDLTAGAVTEIIQRRKEKPFQKLDDLKEISGLPPVVFARISSRLTVSSAHFEVRIVGSFREARVVVTAVVYRLSGSARLVYYRVN